MNRVEIPEIDLEKHAKLIFNNGEKATQWSKETILSTNGTYHNWTYLSKMET